MFSSYSRGSVLGRRKRSASLLSAVHSNRAGECVTLVGPSACEVVPVHPGRSLLKDPPKLDGLFRKQTLPSGAPATDEQVRDVILHGRGITPPFEQSLDAEDLNDLLRLFRFAETAKKEPRLTVGSDRPYEDRASSRL